MLMQEVLESFMNAMFSEKDKGNPYIRRALRFMADNYSEHLELAQAAEYVGLSSSYFSTLFRDVVGVTFREQLCRIRVEESKHLLLSKKIFPGGYCRFHGLPRSELLQQGVQTDCGWRTESAWPRQPLKPTPSGKW